MSWTDSLVGRQIWRGVMANKGSKFLRWPPSSSPSGTEVKPGSLKQRPCWLLSPPAGSLLMDWLNQLIPCSGHVIHQFWVNQQSYLSSSWPFLKQEGRPFWDFKPPSLQKSLDVTFLSPRSASQRVFFSVCWLHVCFLISSKHLPLTAGSVCGAWDFLAAICCAPGFPAF